MTDIKGVLLLGDSHATKHKVLDKRSQNPYTDLVTRVSKIARATSDVAKLAQVSRTTVSFILNNVPGVILSTPTRQRVLAAAKKLNYSPNVAGKKLVSRKSYTIGLVLCQSPEQISPMPFFPG